MLYLGTTLELTTTDPPPQLNTISGRGYVYIIITTNDDFKRWNKTRLKSEP